MTKKGQGMKNPFYNYGKALKELGECLMNIDTKLNVLVAKAHACRFRICFTTIEDNLKEIGTKGK